MRARTTHHVRHHAPRAPCGTTIAGMPFFAHVGREKINSAAKFCSIETNQVLRL
jgi:hypothetical protein